MGAATELGQAMGMSRPPTPGRAVLFCYAGLAVGDLGSGVLSQVLRSRKKIVAAFIAFTALMMVVHFTLAGRSLTTFYAICTILGIAIGYWAVFVTIASEQFGTNLRATATTTVPNFVRGAVIPINMGFLALTPRLGLLGSAAAVGATTVVLALVALTGLEETFGKDLDYLEVV
jgi:hypothetical protein